MFYFSNPRKVVIRQKYLMFYILFPKNLFLEQKYMQCMWVKCLMFFIYI